MKASRHLLLGTIALLMWIVPHTAFAKTKVVATVGDLAAMAEEVGGEHVDVELLASPQEDPHFVDAKPSFVREVAQADLLVVNGMSLEQGWLPTLVKGSRNAKVQPGAKGYFDVSNHMGKKLGPSRQNGGRQSRAEGDVHPEGNPHYSLSPKRMARAGLALAKRLGELDPKNADAYKAQGRAFAKKALELANKWEKNFEALPAKCRRVVVYHDAWHYLADWLTLEPVIAIEPKPGVAPNPRHIADVFKTMKSQNLGAILQMEYYPNSNSQMLANKTDAKLISVDGQTRQGQSYIKRADKLAGEIYSALKANCN